MYGPAAGLSNSRQMKKRDLRDCHFRIGYQQPKRWQADIKFAKCPIHYEISRKAKSAILIEILEFNENQLGYINIIVNRLYYTEVGKKSFFLIRNAA